MANELVLLQADDLVGNNPIIDNDDLVIARGSELLKRQHEGGGFDDVWIPIGQGVLAIQRRVEVSPLVRPSKKGARGALYNKLFGEACAGTAYADMAPTVRSNLLFCMKHLEKINEMRTSWSVTERSKINHPSSIASRLRAHIKAPTDGQPPRKNASPMAMLKEELEASNQAVQELQKKVVAMKSGSLFDLKHDSADDIASVIVGTVTDHKAAAIAKKIQEKRKKKQSAPGG